ncbi:MAG: CDP-alcohol phosphatidyltransferase family protein [Fidelibacterota bacterium]
MSFKDKYSAYKNRQAKDWWTSTIGDPLSWLILTLIGDWKWVTPTGITILSFFAKLLPAALMLTNERHLVISAAILLQIGQVLDSMDGNLARYRKETSIYGGFLDRILDGIGFIFVSSGLAYYAFINGADAYYLLLGPMAAAFYLVVCYIYWSIAYEEQKHIGTGKKIQPGKNVKSLKDIPTWKYILKGQKKIFLFNQADFYFWIGFGLIFEIPEFSLWLLFLVLLKKMFSRVIKRSKYLKEFDKEIGR